MLTKVFSGDTCYDQRIVAWTAEEGLFLNWRFEQPFDIKQRWNKQFCKTHFGFGPFHSFSARSWPAQWLGRRLITVITLPLLTKGRKAEGHFEHHRKTPQGTESLLFPVLQWLFWFWKESEVLSNLFPKQRKVLTIMFRWLVIESCILHSWTNKGNSFDKLNLDSEAHFIWLQITILIC